MSEVDSGLDNILKGSLESAFDPSPDITKAVVTSPPEPYTSISAEPTPDKPTASSAPDADAGVDDNSETWKDDYEKYLAHWKAESAMARKKAEETREIWEKRREEEKKSGKERRDDWEGLVGVGEAQPQMAVNSSVAGSPSPSTDAQESISNKESGKESGKESHEANIPPNKRPSTPYSSTLTNAPASEKHSPESSGSGEKSEWTNINEGSVSASYPDISFASPSRPSSPPAHSHPHSHSHSRHTHTSDPQRRESSTQQHPPSATLSVFDTTLSTRTRLYALTSALAINFFLPFVNGVMLGFGEIFARNLVGWFGWGGGGVNGRDGRGRSSATAVGIGAVGRERREEINRKSWGEL